VKSTSIVKGEIDPDNGRRIQSLLGPEHDDGTTDRDDLNHRPTHAHETMMAVPSSPTRETKATTAASEDARAHAR
jgi:hypothetical protein